MSVPLTEGDWNRLEIAAEKTGQKKTVLAREGVLDKIKQVENGG